MTLNNGVIMVKGSLGVESGIVCPKKYVKVLTPEYLRMPSSLETGLLQIKLIKMKLHWIRVDPKFSVTIVLNKGI